MLSKLNRRQKQWLENATPEQRKAFAAKGPAEVAEMHNFTTGKDYFIAGLRGLMFDQRQFDNYDAAYKHAEIELAHLQADSTLLVLDEVTLGIDGRNATINDQLEQATVMAKQILHLGAMVTDTDTVPDAVEEFIDDLDSHLAAELAEDMPWLATLLGQDTDTEEDEQDSSLSLGEKIEFFNEQVYRHACYGYLVQYATPVFTPHRGSSGDWNGGSFSWGYYSTQWFYGETLEETVGKALGWAEARRAAEITKAEAMEAETEVAA